MVVSRCGAEDDASSAGARNNHKITNTFSHLCLLCESLHPHGSPPRNESIGLPYFIGARGPVVGVSGGENCLIIDKLTAFQDFLHSEENKFPTTTGTF